MDLNDTWFGMAYSPFWVCHVWFMAFPWSPLAMSKLGLTSFPYMLTYHVIRGWSHWKHHFRFVRSYRNPTSQQKPVFLLKFALDPPKQIQSKTSNDLASSSWHKDFNSSSAASVEAWKTGAKRSWFRKVSIHSIHGTGVYHTYISREKSAKCG